VRADIAACPPFFAQQTASRGLRRRFSSGLGRASPARTARLNVTPYLTDAGLNLLAVALGLNR